MTDGKSHARRAARDARIAREEAERAQLKPVHKQDGMVRQVAMYEHRIDGADGAASWKPHENIKERLTFRRSFRDWLRRFMPDDARIGQIENEIAALEPAFEALPASVRGPGPDQSVGAIFG